MLRFLPVLTVLAAGAFAFVRYGVVGVAPKPEPEAPRMLAPVAHRLNGAPIDLSREEPARPRADEPSHSEPGKVPARSIMTLERRADLRSFRRELAQSIGELESNLLACEVGDAVFQLDIETVAGGARITDATVTSPGGASAQALDCARARLRGYTLGTPSAETGRHLTMPFAVRVAAR
jgi:hypothetical protein